MTLDEAIKHAEEVAERNETHAEKWQKEGGEKWGKTTVCRECAEEHRQLAEWLKELKELKEHSVSFQRINELAKLGISATGQSDSYFLGMCNGIEWMRGTLTNTHCNFFDSEVTE